ncbi:hypothetical protein [Meiothermus granaticius]|uniref:Uncharacterized protein n=1 Tax=Meiothermus granaticius NBRC 107808 TaxID=1227551 RepID=A0A399F8Y3_9DEIN|nr:hypothetical protein [Meiothermus granaticius]RIH92590.1 hypothetical protein Mgrana_01490 [Meiothermus granaticius NBRC 107808]GEM88063.1 hypothetical protein MGR01S_26880 [Meiothermus granaticius NBRC 107808]
MYHEYLIARDPRTGEKLEVREITDLGEEALTDVLLEVYEQYEGKVDLETLGQHFPWGESPFLHDQAPALKK